MDECFESNIDRHTGINVLQRVIYNCGYSNLMRINLTRFFTAVLVKDDNIISVAALSANALAQNPVFHARTKHTLCRFRVENIIIPSVDEVVGMWRKGYDFSLIRDELMNKLVEYNTLTFPTAVKLQKSLLASPVEAKPYYAVSSIFFRLPNLEDLHKNLNTSINSQI
ncbi:hypothetical protein ACOSP7_027023 [Xanthoceras sorbifolium]